MKREEFLRQIEECNAPSKFDQRLLDQSAAMLEKWGLLAHDTWNETDKDHLFKDFGLTEKAGDSEAAKKEKAELRCIISKIMKTQIGKADALGIMKNFNKIREPGFRWLQ